MSRRNGRTPSTYVLGDIDVKKELSPLQVPATNDTKTRGVINESGNIKLQLLGVTGEISINLLRERNFTKDVVARAHPTVSGRSHPTITGRRFFIKGGDLGKVLNQIYNQLKIHIKLVLEQPQVKITFLENFTPQRANKRIINLSLQDIWIISIVVVAMESTLMVKATMDMETSFLEGMRRVNTRYDNYEHSPYDCYERYHQSYGGEVYFESLYDENVYGRKNERCSKEKESEPEKRKRVKENDCFIEKQESEKEEQREKEIVVLEKSEKELLLKDFENQIGANLELFKVNCAFLLVILECCLIKKLMVMICPCLMYVKIQGQNFSKEGRMM
ncbi:hypothetical protein M9H77_02500 [Catharanthus roseus]|uniref:Uncharacterized protein n=1 Tax=Catharanthus roseus TaxID=4058 RepID=A0ACC0C8Z7_CATRO|nr:hypothetical protein M9H77_02500 [Catharanthus roseus]